MTYTYEFPMAGVTATMVIYSPKTSEVLLGLRRKDSDVFPNCWCLPGGYLNAGTERLINVARRETREDTGVDIIEDRWEFFYNDDEPGSDSRYVQVINLCYFVHVTDEEYGTERAGDDLIEVKWVHLEEAHTYELAFAHNMILREFDR